MNTETKLSLIMAVFCSIAITTSILNKEYNHIIKVEEVANTAASEVVDDTSDTEKSTTSTKASKTTTTKKPTTQTKTTKKPKQNTSYKYGNFSVPSNNTIKSYMDYRCITLKSSRQYKLQSSLAYTGNYGIRMVGDRYCIAVGSYYTTTIGQYIDVELKNGKVIKGILADCKSDAHTDSTNRINPNGSVVEFVVDTKALDNTAKVMGDVSYVNGWNSKVVNIKVYSKVAKF